MLIKLFHILLSHHTPSLSVFLSLTDSKFSKLDINKNSEYERSGQFNINVTNNK